MCTNKWRWMYCTLVYKCIQRRKNSCKQKNYENWEAGNFKELELGTLFAMQCLMKSERCWRQTLEQFLAFSFALDLSNQLHALCILHLPLKTFGQLAGICQIRRGRPQNWEEIFNFRAPLQGQQRGRAFCFGCWVLWQCSSSSSSRRRRRSAWPICATHRLVPTFDICHNHLLKQMQKNPLGWGKSLDQKLWMISKF